MNTGGDAANEMVQYYFEALKCAATITGKGAEHALGILLNEMKNHKQTKGKTRLNSMLKSGALGFSFIASLSSLISKLSKSSLELFGAFSCLLSVFSQM